MIREVINVATPKRIRANDLGAAIEAEIGSEIGFMFVFDESKRLKQVIIDRDEKSSLDSKAIQAVVSSHNLAENEKDDFELAEEAKLQPSILERLAILEARVTALEEEK